MPKRRREEKKALKNAAEEEKSLKNAAEEATKRYTDYRQKTEDEAFRDFEEELTFKTFYELCDTIRDGKQSQCADTLRDVGHKIPVPELKKILDFIDTEGHDRKWEDCEFSVYVILEAHHMQNSWANISDERLECLLPWLDYDDDHDFWSNLLTGEGVRDPTDMSIKELRAVFDNLLKRQTK